jgi:hypothetical protein
MSVQSTRHQKLINQAGQWINTNHPIASPTTQPADSRQCAEVVNAKPFVTHRIALPSVTPRPSIGRPAAAVRMLACSESPNFGNIENERSTVIYTRAAGRSMHIPKFAAMSQIGTIMRAGRDVASAEAPFSGGLSRGADWQVRCDLMRRYGPLQIDRRSANAAANLPEVREPSHRGRGAIGRRGANRHPLQQLRRTFDGACLGRHDRLRRSGCSGKRPLTVRHSLPLARSAIEHCLIRSTA